MKKRAIIISLLLCMTPCTVFAADTSGFSSSDISNTSEKAKALMIAEAIQLIVQLRRLPDGRRVTSHICSVEGIGPDGNVSIKDIFIYNYDTGKFEYTGYFPKKICEHLTANGVNLTENMLKEA